MYVTLKKTFHYFSHEWGLRDYWFYVQWIIFTLKCCFLFHIDSSYTNLFNLYNIILDQRETVVVLLKHFLSIRKVFTPKIVLSVTRMHNRVGIYVSISFINRNSLQCIGLGWFHSSWQDNNNFKFMPCKDCTYVANIRLFAIDCESRQINCL